MDESKGPKFLNGTVGSPFDQMDFFKVTCFHEFVITTVTLQITNF